VRAELQPSSSSGGPVPGAAHVVVLSSLYPSARAPLAGTFVRERMLRVARRLPVTIVAPTPWFPFQGLLRHLRAGFRPGAPRFERQDDVDVWYPRYFSPPAIGKRFDGFFMALGAYLRLRKLKREGALDVIDAHFCYPDGYAGALLGRWLGVPVAITLRGKEERLARVPALRARMCRALAHAGRVFTVSGALARVAADLGAPGDRIRLAENGVDADRFMPIDRLAARAKLGVPAQARVLVSVGGLVERKGFHRVIECLPALRRDFPGLLYLAVGGPGPEGDFGAQLRAQVQALGLGEIVRFTGPKRGEDLCAALSAADVFVLATSYEGWANVFLEAMACGLPVVTTDVGGNREVVARDELGIVVPFGDACALRAALATALRYPWDRAALRAHAKASDWTRTVELIVHELSALAAAGSRLPRAPHLTSAERGRP